MQKTKLHNKSYIEFNESYQLVLPLNLECLIPENESIRLLSHVLDGLNLYGKDKKACCAYKLS